MAVGKPPFGVQLNTTHAMYPYIKWAIHGFSDHDPYDLVSGVTASIETSISRGTVDGGSVYGATGDGSVGTADDHNYPYFPYLAAYQPAGDYTIIVSGRPTSANDASGTNDYTRRGGGSAGGHFASCGGFASSCGWNIQLGSGKIQIEAYHGATVLAQYQSSSTIWSTGNGDPEVFHRFALVRSGTTMQWWMDGAKLGTAYTCPAGDMTTGSAEPLYLLTYDARGGSPPIHGHGGFYSGGHVSQCLGYATAFSDTYASLFTTDDSAYQYMAASRLPNTGTRPRGFAPGLTR